MFRRKPRELTDADIAEVQRLERDTLKDHFASLKSEDNVWLGVERLLLAGSPREVVAAIEAYPVLLTERGDLALSHAEWIATMLRMWFAPGVIADRRAWIERLRDVDASAGRLALPDD